MIRIYHNPRCRKSREGLALVEASGKPYEVIRYLDDHLNARELENLLRKLNLPASGLVRTGETVWKANYKGRNLDEAGILEALATHPVLMERPVVERDGRAVIGRPPEIILSLLSD